MIIKSPVTTNLKIEKLEDLEMPVTSTVKKMQLSPEWWLS